MLAIGIRYLNGFVAASAPDARERAEWPPHPGRVFMALAAAHFQTDGDTDERKALTWLEELPEAPAIRAGTHEPRAGVLHYVPVNDKAGPAKAVLHGTSLTRDRQPRTFARATLEHDTVYMVWPTAAPTEEQRVTLEQLCAKVTRIGHSSSLVQMWIARDSEVGEPNWLPDEDRAELHLRIPAPGTLSELERRYNREAVDEYAALEVAAEDDADKKTQKAAKKRLKADFPDGAPLRFRPELSVYQGYAEAASLADGIVAPGTVLSPHFTVVSLERADGPRSLDLPCTLLVVERFREAILSKANDLPAHVQSLLSGHGDTGAPLEQPHVALLPLAFVGHPHADARLLGLGIALPNAVSGDDRRMALRAVARVERLVLGRLGAWNLGQPAAARPVWNLRAEAWTAHPKGATHWSTVTPVVFDRHPKAKGKAAYQREVAEMIRTSCTRVGLPAPREVIVTPVSVHLGVPPAHAFPRLRRKDGSERRHAHAIIVFDEPVRGPVLLGAGRYRGYGVCRAIGEEGMDREGRG